MSLLLLYCRLFPSPAQASFDEEEQRQWMKQKSRRKMVTASASAQARPSLDQQMHAGSPFLGANRHRPRHLLGGVAAAARTLLYGGLASVAVGVGGPLASGVVSAYVLVSNRVARNRLAGRRGGYVLPAISGLIGGSVVGGVAAGIAAVSVGLYSIYRAAVNLCVGITATPGHLSQLIRRQVWDPHERRWRDRRQSLEEERRELLWLMEEQEEEAARKRKDMDVVETRLYDTLEISPDASKALIKKAYFTKARHTHPDKNRDDPHAHKKFLELHEAYSTLINDAKRYDYNRWGSAAGRGHRGETGGPRRVMPENFDANLFVAVLFSGEGNLSSPTVELFVGDLGLARALDIGHKLFSLIESIIIMKKEGQMHVNDRKLLEELLEGKEKKDDMQWAHRMVEIATTLARQGKVLSEHHARELSDSQYGAALEERFREEVRDAARKILEESAFYGTTYLEMIGSSMMQSRFPYADAIYQKWATRKALLRGAHEFYQCLPTLFDGQPQRREITIDIEAFLPGALGLIDLVNRADIAAAMRGAIWKVLHDPGASRQELRYRQRAIRIIGEEFTQISASGDERVSQELLTNFELAFRIASKRA